jgi:phage tail sheath protein FI
MSNSALDAINVRRTLSHIEQNLHQVVCANTTIGEMLNPALAKERIKEVTDDFMRNLKERGAIIGSESTCERVYSVVLRDTKRGARVDCLSEDGKVLQTVKYSGRRYARKRMNRKIGLYIIAWEIEPQPMQVYQIKVSI